MHLLRILGVMLASLPALSACTPAPAPTVTPTPMCTTEFGASRTQCSATEFERMKQTDARYAEAKRVFRRILQLEMEASRSGEHEPSEEALSLTDGLQRSGLPDLYRQSSAAYVSGEVRITSVERRPPGDEYKDPTLALLVCLDQTELITRAPDRTTGSAGGIVPVMAHFTEGATTKLWLLADAEGETCAS